MGTAEKENVFSKLYLIMFGIILVPLFNLANAVTFLGSIVHAKFNIMPNQTRLLYAIQLIIIGLLMGLTFVIAARAATGKNDIKKPLTLFFMGSFIAAFNYVLLAVYHEVTSCSFQEAKMFGIQVLISGVIWLPLFTKQQQDV